MTDEKRWKIQEMTTEGWTSIDPKTDNLLKEECDEWLNRYLEGGIPPTRLRAVRSHVLDDGLASLDNV
tara:strand:- start:55 stop:258 length:204 start_codon:yes stop_codon:yes gene_type:complete